MLCRVCRGVCPRVDLDRNRDAGQRRLSFRVPASGTVQLAPRHCTVASDASFARGAAARRNVHSGMASATASRHLARLSLPRLPVQSPLPPPAPNPFKNPHNRLHHFAAPDCKFSSSSDQFCDSTTAFLSLFIEAEYYSYRCLGKDDVGMALLLVEYCIYFQDMMWCSLSVIRLRLANFSICLLKLSSL